MIDKDLDKYYSDRFTLFMQQGWKDFIEDMETLKEPLLNIKSLKTQDELQFRKGQLDILDWVLSLQDMSNKAYKELSEEVN